LPRRFRAPVSPKCAPSDHLVDALLSPRLWPAAQPIVSDMTDVPFGTASRPNPAIAMPRHNPVPLPVQAALDMPDAVAPTVGAGSFRGFLKPLVHRAPSRYGCRGNATSPTALLPLLCKARQNAATCPARTVSSTACFETCHAFVSLLLSASVLVRVQDDESSFSIPEFPILPATVRLPYRAAGGPILLHHSRGRLRRKSEVRGPYPVLPKGSEGGIMSS